MPVDKVLYDRLGIHHTATHEDVKQSYRKAALKWHPDKNTDSQAEDRFKECSEAYEVLADPSRRQAYDRHGLSAATSSNPNPAASSTPAAWPATGTGATTIPVRRSANYNYRARAAPYYSTAPQAPPAATADYRATANAPTFYPTAQATPANALTSSSSFSFQASFSFSAGEGVGYSWSRFVSTNNGGRTSQTSVFGGNV